MTKITSAQLHVLQVLEAVAESNDPWVRGSQRYTEERKPDRNERDTELGLWAGRVTASSAIALERKGLVATKWDGGGTLYSITAEGRAKLKELTS